VPCCNPLKCASMQFTLLAAIAAGAAGLHLRTHSQRGMIEAYLQRPTAAEGGASPAVDPLPHSSVPKSDVGDEPPGENGGAGNANDGGVGEPPAEQTAPGPFSLASLGEMITVEQALNIYNLPFSDEPDPPTVIFIDAREREHFLKAHVPGAYHITPQSFVNSTLPDDMEFWPKDSIIVVYCSGGDCDSSHLVRTRLIHERLFERVFIMEAGLPGWIEAQLPTDAGDAGN